MINFKSIAIEILSKCFEQMDVSAISDAIETPPSREMGDYAFPTFSLAKTLRKNPAQIASEAVAGIAEHKGFERIEAKGAYINFFIDKLKLVNEVVIACEDKDIPFGSSNLGNGKNVVVEFSSPNIAKPFHIGHIRTTVIGHALYNIYKFLGYNTIAINHLGDYGTQFGLLISAYKRWGDKAVVEADPINELLKLYVRINQEAEEKPELRDEARAYFKALEDGDEECVELWTWFRTVSLKEFNKVYDMLGIKYDSFAGESFYSDKMQAVIDIMEEKDILEDSEGAKIVRLADESIPPVLIQKSDGSTLYTTRDIAAAFYRKKTYDFHKNIYVVGSQQILHFKAWKEVVKLMGYDWADDCIHVPFGMVSLPDGTLSTRKGRVVYLIDVLNKATELAYDIIKDREFTGVDKEKLASDIGIGAIVFQELFNQRIKDYVFNWDRALSFEGETGPYLQYTHARICSLLQKGNYKETNETEICELTNPQEAEIAWMLYQFPQVIVDAHEKYEPFYITRQIIEIAKAFNSYYNQCPILVDDEKVKNERLRLANATRIAIANGLALLGINAPEKM